MAVLGLSTAFSPPRGSCIAVRIRHGARPTGRSNLFLRRKAGGSAIAVRAEVSFVNGDEAKRLVAEEGYTVLDIRDRTQHERAHIKNSAHVPFFIENEDNDIGTIIKRTAHNNFAGLFFGLPFTKLNPEFTKTVKEKFSPESKLLVVCQEGLRSTGAASALEREGFQNLACISSGLQTLKPGTFESVGKSELQNAGKAGLVTIQGKISVVLGTVLISAYLFITLFPDQAEKLFDLAGIKLIVSLSKHFDTPLGESYFHCKVNLSVGGLAGSYHVDKKVRLDV
uniref:Rhodanese domain-containing protein n=1 Tax=Leersia perrieri TaxID=77586 RepID=A0A0D9XBZ4_9ORYZ